MSHHALLLYDVTPLACDVAAIIKTEPTIIYRKEKCTIADVREIIQAAWLRPVADQTSQFIVVATEFIIEEAQQALLKIVEEPPQGTAFVFVVPEGYALLPTLQSRFQILDTHASLVTTGPFDRFRDATIAERMELIESALKQKDTTWQKAIKLGLAEYLKQSLELSPAIVESLAYVLATLLTRGASNKFLLEQLALVLPRDSKL